MTVTVRPAVAGDRDAILALHADAFAGPAEARLVSALEAEGDAMLSIVADARGAVIGHVLFSRMDVRAGARSWRAAALAPVAVAAAHRGGGIASALIEAGLGMLADDGVDYVFVLGEPDFYERFGFAADVAARFASPYAGPFWLGLALGAASLPVQAQAIHAPAFAALADAA